MIRTRWLGKTWDIPPMRTPSATLDARAVGGYLVAADPKRVPVILPLDLAIALPPDTIAIVTATRELAARGLLSANGTTVVVSEKRPTHLALYVVPAYAVDVCFSSDDPPIARVLFLSAEPQRFIEDITIEGELTKDVAFD